MTKLGDAENRTVVTCEAYVHTCCFFFSLVILTLFLTASKHAIQFLHAIERKTAFQFAFLYFILTITNKNTVSVIEPLKIKARSISI